MNIGIINPLVIESQHFKNIIKNQKDIFIDGVNYLTGKIDNKNIVLVNSGLGKVNAAMICSRLIRDFNPKLIFLSGSSGHINPKLTKGDIIIGQNILDADFGKLSSNGIKFQYHEYLHHPQKMADLPLKFTMNDTVLSNLRKLFSKNQKVKFGNIATSDLLPNPGSQIELLDKNGIDIVDMESSAISQTCWLFNINYIIVRGICNDANDAISCDDITMSANQAAEVVEYVIRN